MGGVQYSSSQLLLLLLLLLDLDLDLDLDLELELEVVDSASTLILGRPVLQLLLDLHLELEVVDSASTLILGRSLREACDGKLMLNGKKLQVTRPVNAITYLFGLFPLWGMLFVFDPRAAGGLSIRKNRLTMQE